MYTVTNDLSNLQLFLEHDSGYVGMGLTKEDLEEAARDKLVFSPQISAPEDDSTPVLEGCSYIWVDPDYRLNLSPGQEKLYYILLALQESSIYTITTVGKLAEAMGLVNPFAAGKRLENLQSLGAITGFRP